MVETEPWARQGMTLWADWLVIDAECVLHPGWVRLAAGEVLAAGEGTGGDGARRAGEVLTPGCVNAHAHLDLCGLRGSLPERGTLVEWIEALIERKEECPPESWPASVRAGVRELLASGTTGVGDIDAAGIPATLRSSPLRAISFREWIAPRAELARESLAALRAARLAPSDRHQVGLAPHAPYTVARSALAAVAEELAAGCPVQMHILESEEELEWSLHAAGALRDLLLRRGIPAAVLEAWGERPPAFLKRMGLLRSGFSIAHGNLLQSNEAQWLARAGVGVVFCPGTHRRFARELDPLEVLREREVCWALGSDSVLSGGDLDLRAQARIGAELHHEIPPREWFDAATRGGARVLGFSAGVLRPGCRADLVGWSASDPISSEDTLFERWIEGGWQVESLWIDGCRVAPPGD